MNKKTYTLNTLLVAVLGLLLMVAVLVRTFAPRIILPRLDLPNLVLISVAVLIAEHYLAPGAKRCYVCVALFGALSFGLLPFAACFVGIWDALKLALTGGIVFTVTTWVFSMIQDRLSTGPAAKAAPFISGLGLYLAAQALMGLF